MALSFTQKKLTCTKILNLYKHGRNGRIKEKRKSTENLYT